MNTLLTFTTVAILCAPCFGEPPSREESAALSNAAARYRGSRDTNQLQIIETFYKKFPDCSNLSIGMIKADANTIPLFVRLLKQTPESSVFREVVITKLRFAPESDELLKLLVEAALNQRESEDTRLAAIYGLMDSQWTKREPALTEIYLKLEEEKYHERMLGVAIREKKAALAEVFLGYYRQFHPEQEARYAKHFDRFQQMKAKLAEDAKNPQPDPVALIRAQREWWDNFHKKEHKVTLAQARTGVAEFVKAPAIDRLELVIAIQQSGVADAELLKRLEELVPGEPSGLIKIPMIDIVALHKPTTQAILQYYRHVAATEKDAEIVSSIQSRIKLIEEGKMRK